MDENLEKQLREIIEKNLPAQVGETLQKELKELTRLREGNFEERAKAAETKARTLEQEKANLESREIKLKNKEKELELREAKLSLDTQINELKLDYERQIKTAYDEINKRLLANRIIRETVQAERIEPVFGTTKTRDCNGNETTSVFQTHTIPLNKKEIIETEEK